MEALEQLTRLNAELGKNLRIRDRQIGQLLMLKKVLELTAPIAEQLPPAYLAALRRLDATDLGNATP